MKTYKAVAGPKNISVEHGATQAAFDSFAALINQNCVDGWEYHSMETIAVTEKAGCALSQQVSVTSYYMLIFVKEV